ncbi:MAG: MATE family efflux transporter [Acidobacteria bacterium]|nr:MAG: MATE family efflux transporter [Acidobacteriota bacterium]REJ99146.1 MAG: MATE family efflux transporter [Acidobacteriota bacterium]REK16133.1 MAG: MATE family efflux transporter [Acidobacteriota bacterium]REK43814.1 MAG: MATE family efflux transporter [Acidobacteriota bacterium]
MSTSSNSVRSPARDYTLWSVLVEAIRGSNRDFTKGSIGLSVFLLAVPMILEMIMESIFAVVDVFFVARLGAEAVAVVGITESMMVLIYAVAIGLSIGATATVSRRIGEKDFDGAARSATHAIYMGIVVSVVMGVVGVIWAPEFLGLIGAEPEVVAQGVTFTRIMLGANCVVVFLFLLNAIFRGAGDAAIAMRVLWLSNALNIVLDPMLIFGIWIFPELGVTGAAVATVIGRGIGVIYASYVLFYGEKRFQIRAEHWKLDVDRFKRLFSVSWVAVLQFLIGTASWLGLMRVVAGFGSQAVAGYTISIRIVIFALLPSVGLANAAATLVGQNLGAQKSDRAERSVWTAAKYNAIFQTSIGIAFAIFAEPIVWIFTTEPEVSRYAVDSLRIISYGFFFYAIGMVVETAFNGAGDTWTPTYLNLFVFWLFEIPLAIVLAHYFGYGPYGVFWAITIAFSMLAVVSVILFRRGKWKLMEV